MSFDFILPLSKDDLLNRTGVNQYIVDEILPIRLLAGKLQECRSVYRCQGPKAVLQHFDTVFSVLTHLHNIDPDPKEQAWELVLKGILAHANQLPEVLSGELDPESRLDHLNILKMHCYLLCQFVDHFEAEATKPSVVTGKGRGKSGKSKKTQDTSGWHWDEERERALQALSQLLQLNVNRLWDPPVVEEEFVNLITCCCYKLLENPNITKCKATKDTIFHLLGTMIRKYNHALGASLKIIQLLQHFEHLTSPLAQAVEMFAVQFGAKSVVGEILREISRMDSRDLENDASGARAYAAFMVELAERIPDIVLPSMSVLVGLLDEEPYTMRNGVLGVMAEIVVKSLSKEDLDSKMKNTRDQFLDKLEDHIHDVHAFVRSKCLQIWLNIVAEKALPLPRQQHLVELVIGRLLDKSSQVRKYAIQLMTALLRSNPFAAKLPLEELKANYEQEKAKLQEMMPDQPEEMTPETQAEQQALSEWETIASKIKSVLVDMEEDETNDDEEKKLIDDEDTIEGVQQKIYDLLKEENYKDAICMLREARESWPGHHLFVEHKDTDDEDDSAEEAADEQQKLLTCMQVVFMAMSGASSSIADVVETAATESNETENNVVNEVTKQQVLVQYLKDSMTFASLVQKAVPVICQLLGSKNITDVMEAIEFFVTGFEFGVANSMSGICRMLALIWSKESSIKDAVVGAYKRLYLSPTGGNARARSLAVVNNLIALVSHGVTLGDLTSLEEMICQFVKSEEIGSGVIKMLWEKFTLKLPDTTPADSRSALALLGMAAGAEVDIISSNIEVLVKEGLGARAENDFLLVRDTCLALQKLGGTGKPKPGQVDKPFRLPQTHNIFTRLAEVLIMGVTKAETSNWIPAAEQAVNVIYKLAEHPDLICGEIVKKLAETVITVKQASGTAEKETNETQEEQQQGDAPENAPAMASCPAFILTRLLSIAGHIALRQLVFLDTSVMGELKRRHNIQETEQEQKKGKKADANKTKESTSAEGIEEELGLTGAAAEDAEAEYIRKVAENEIVTGRNLLAVLRPLIVTVCNNQVKYSDPALRTAATLALAKFMMVSSEFCDAHLQLLFTILEKSSSPTIRANTIIALGDLTFRFPNMIEPWTPNLYARLRDDSPKVRKHTLMVLTHLILNDMVKVKGQISEMATCIVDSDARIADLAKLFFHELSKKGNAIYNIMPDVISRLSDPDVGVAEDHFRTIMKYLFSFIQKDRQCESLVEKLCHRFKAARVDRQWRDLSFCLSLLSYSEKSIRKLQENFSCYGDKLADEEVYTCFVTILSGAKKFAKPEAKALVEEFEQRIEQCHTKGMDDDAVAQKASKVSAVAAGRNRKASSRQGGKAQKGRTPAARRRKKVDSDDEEEEEVIHPARRNGKKNTKSKPKLSFSSDEESDLEMFDVSEKSQSRNQDQENDADNESDTENANPNIESSPVLSAVKSKTRKKLTDSVSKTRKSSRARSVKT